MTFSLACKKPRLCEAFSRAFRRPFIKGGYAPSIGEYHGGVLFHFYDGQVTSVKRGGPICSHERGGRGYVDFRTGQRMLEIRRNSDQSQRQNMDAFTAVSRRLMSAGVMSPIFPMRKVSAEVTFPG